MEATSTEIWSTTLVATYRTDPEAVAAVLPPPLSPTGDPLVRVPSPPSTWAAATRSSEPGHSRSTPATTMSMGDYALVMPMTTEQAVDRRARDLRRAEEARRDRPRSRRRHRDGLVHQDGDDLRRDNRRVAGEVEPAPERTRTSFYLKFLPSPTGKGFDGDPLLVHVPRRERTRKQWKVDGEVILRESRFDPVVDLPVLEMLDIELAERSSFQTGEVVAELARRLDRALRTPALRRHVPGRASGLQDLT